MKNMLRRNLALLLAVVMILSCAPLDGMAAVIGASQLFDQFADQLATDYSGGASIARIVQPPAAVDTYVFMVDDKPIATQKVKKGDVLYEPAAPSKEGHKFIGWRDAAESAPVFGLVTAEATGETYTYTAQFDQVYYVFFMDDQGRVQITREGTADDEISTQVTIKLQNAQAAVTGWYYDAALTQPVQEGHVTLSDANITLWPKVEEGYYLTFETNGGTYYPPAFYMPGKPTVDPGVPQKAGYSFTGWKDETGASFTFGSALTADKTLTAQWQANQNTQYTVIHWMENANDDGYSFKESEEKTGTTGEQTAATARNYTGFTAQTIAQTAIAADGSTIVSVYYKRNVYDVKFYTANGYSSSEYTDLRITAKYGASIGDKWPTYNGSNTWSTKRNGSGPYQVNIDTMPLNGANFYGPKTGSSSETAYYYVEVLPGETGTDVGGKSYKLHHSDTSPGTGYTVTVEDQYPITGYTFNASVSTKTGGRYNNAKFYYTRNSYAIIYMNGGSEVTSYRTSVLFEQTIPGAANKPAPTPPMGKENYTFEGWYDDPAGQALHKFSGEMPAQNITVYAKWAPPTVSGTAYITMAGNGSAPITIAYGGTINPDDLPTPTAPEGDGWEFVAWATKDGDVYTPFNFDTKIYKNIELYPYYVNKNQYQVTYRPGQGTGTVEDTRRYASGAEADVKAAAGLTPPAGKVFVGWKVESTDEIKQPGDKLTITGNMTLTAQWGDAPAAVTLTYYGNGGKTADGQTSTSVTHENNATISTLGSTAFTRRGYTLTGWNTQANGQGDHFDCGASVLIDSHGDNALYAVWALDAEQTVTVTYASEDAQKGTVSHTGDTIQIVSGDPVTGSTAAANPGYTFIGWYKGEARISREAALTAATAKASLNKDADGLYADTTYIARFTERTDLSYTVHYYWNGTATPVAESKTVDGQTYGASITESPKPVDGCTPVSTASQTITIGAETNKIIFYYYKNVELTAKGDNVTYDGKEHTVSGFTGAPEAADFSAIQVGATGTNADTYPAVFPEGTVGTVDANGKYIVTEATNGALVINPIADKVTVTVTEKSDTVTYDGTEHTVTGYESITADNTLYNVKASVKETPTAAWTAKGTNAGEYPVGIEAKDFKNINENFTNVEFVIVDGLLKIDPVATKVTVTVTEKSGNATYDGTEHTVTGYESITADNTLYNVKASVKETPTAAWTAKGTNAGEYPVGIEAKDFKNINENFTNVEFVIVDGVLKIDPVKAEVIVTVKENSASHAYDGQAHSVEGYESMTANNTLYNVETDVDATVTLAWKAKGTEVGKYDVGIQPGDFANTNPNFTNVRFVIEDGALKITPAEEQIVVRITGKTGSFTYDGTEKTVTGYDIAITDPNGLYTAANFAFTGSDTAKGTDVGAYAMGLKAEQFQNTNTNFDNEKVTFEVVRDGQLIISQRPVTFTGETATKVYNGEAQSITAIAQSGLVEGHTLAVMTYAATGTDVGEYPGAFKDEAKIMNGTEDVTANYAITKKEGKLTITAVTDKVIVTVTEKSGNATYDGAEHTVTGYKSITADNTLYNVKASVKETPTAAWTAKGTNAGEYPVGIEAKDFKNINENFTNVEFKIVDGVLKIDPVKAEVTVTIVGNHATVLYNARENTVQGYTATSSNPLFNVDTDFTYGQDGPSGEAAKAKAKASGVNVKRHEMGLQSRDFVTVSQNFQHVTYAVTDGYLEIEKRPVAVEVDNSDKVYGEADPAFDNATLRFYEGQQIITPNTEMQAELAGIDLTVHRTDAGNDTVGTHEDVLVISKTAEELRVQYPNYLIGVNPGDFEITATAESLSVRAKNYENAYDGKAHGVVAKAYINKNEEAEAAQIKYWNEATGAYDLDESPAYTDVKSATPGDRVYTVRFQATLDGLTAEGSANVLIAPQELVFTSNSASRDYTGQPLTSPDVTLSSGHIINGEIYDYEATGTVTNAYDGEKGDGVVTNTIVYSTTAAFKPVNYEIELKEGQLDINPREVKLTSQTESKEYDGTPLTMPQVTIGPNGFVEGEVTDIRATGSVTYVTDGPNHDGKVPNTIEYTPAGNFDARNYRIEKNEGVLSITRRTGTMVIETLSDSKVYDGSALYYPYQTLHGSLAKGDQLVVSNYVSDLVNVGNKQNTFESFRVENKAGQDTTANYTFGEPIYGTLEITARPLTITVADNTVTYDGQHHGKADPAYTVNQAAVDAAGKDNGVGLVNPAVGDKTQTHTLTGTDIAFTAVNAGTYENQLNMVKDNVKILSGNQDVTGNYAITILPGTLTISQRPVTFTGETATKVYNGEAQSITAIAQSGLVEGHTLAVMTYAATGTDVGEYPGAFKDEAKIMNGTEDVTANYAITKKEGQLTITAVTDKVIVTVTEKSGTVTYDGQAHSVHGYATMSSNNALYNVNIASNVAAQETAAWTATGTDAGEYPVGIEAKDFKNISQNFTTVEFKIVDGSLIINPITEKTITITAASEEKAYDGTALTNGGYTYTQGVLVNGDVLTATVEGSQTDAGSSANRVTGYKVMHGETDVTKNYTFAQSKDGTLTVKPVAIELTANSAEKIYDGTPLTDNGYQITKGAFVGEEGLASVTVEGSQTLVGTSANEIKAHGLKANTKAQNYAITYQPGQLTVKDRNEKYRLTVEANSGSKVYDGTALKVEGLKQLIFTVNEQTFTVSGLTAEKTATNVSESGAVAVRGTAIVKDAAGNDVTAQFDVQTVPGTLTISQRPVTITANNLEYDYNYESPVAHPAQGVERYSVNEGLLDGDTVTAEVRYDGQDQQTLIGAYDAVVQEGVAIKSGETDVTANYAITLLPGLLKIKGDKIAPNKTTPQQVESNYKLGDTIPFTITVKNVSTAIVENIIVEDPNAILVAGQGYSVSEDGHTATIPSLAPDAQVEIQAQHVVTEADILAGTVGNTATVAWENTTRTVEAKTEEIEEPNSALGVTKETTSTPKNGKTYALGETITYKITVTNTGNLTAKNIQVTDSLSAKEGQVIATIDSLAPGASQEIPFAYVVTEQDILNGKVVNEAAAKGETDDPDKKPEGGDEKEDETDDVDATLEVVKTSNKQEGQLAGLGETIEYTITVTNKGNVTYRNVKVDDELTGLHETIDELGVGASERFTTTYTVTEEDILKGHVRNEATAAADPIHNPKTGEDEIPKGSDEVTDETVAAEGALGVTKETTSTPKNGKTYALGETITYKITVTNTGNLTAKNIQVTDSLSAKEGQVIATIDSLAPGASQEIPFAYVVTEQDILNGKVVNEAAAKGETDDPDKKPEGGDEKEDETDDVDATLEVVKTSNKQEGQLAGLGETIEYTITVTNKGNVTFRNVKVDDELTGLHETIDELGVGASESFTTTYTVTEEDILNGHVRNVATAEGDKVPDPKNPDDPKKPAGEDEQDDPTDEPDASLTVVKSLTNRPNKGYFTLGETAEFDVVVTNTGNVTLKNIRLTEMLDGAEFVTGEGYTVKNGQAVIEELKPGQEDGDGQSVTVKATYTIQTKDLGMGVLKNIVAGEGEGPGKNPDDEGGTEFDVDYAKQVNAVKVWEDEENKHETRPAAITFVLMDESTGEELDRKDATAANEWSVSFDNLPAHDADGNEIIYVLKEIEVTGYDTRYGGPVEPTVAPPVIQGTPETDKGGEQIPGDAEQDEPVERDVHKIDQTIINTLRSHKLTIRYWVEVVGGQKAFDTYEKEYYYNEQYSVVSPGMYGYEPDLPRVQGRMPDEDLEIDVVYVRQIYKLTIYYIFEDGTTAHKEYEAKLYADEKFEVESPEINGYKPNLWMISGVMPDRNLNYTVIYIARTKPVEIQEAVAPLGVGSVVPNTGDCFD